LFRETRPGNLKRLGGRIIEHQNTTKKTEETGLEVVLRSPASGVQASKKIGALKTNHKTIRMKTCVPNGLGGR